MFPARAMTILGGDSFRDEYSLAFDGTNDNIRIPVIEYSVHDADFSFVFWVKRGAASVVHTILGNTGAASDSRIAFISDNTVLIESDTNGDSAIITPNVEDLNWHHWVIVASSGTVTAYQDGVSCSVSGNVGDDNLTIDTIGGAGSGGTTSEFNGNMSEIAVYNIALTSPQAKQIYNGREPFDHKDWAKSGNLQSWWRMGDGVNDIPAADSEGGIIGDEVTPTLGPNLFDAAASVFTSGTYSWVAYDDATISNDSNTLKIVKDDDSSNTNGAYVYLKNASDLSSDLTIGKVYKITFDAKVDTGNSVAVNVNEAGDTLNVDVVITNTSFKTYSLYFKAGSATGSYIRSISMATGEIIWLDNLKLQEFGGNTGVMQNMTPSDFVGDTP